MEKDWTRARGTDTVWSAVCCTGQKVIDAKQGSVYSQDPSSSERVAFPASWGLEGRRLSDERQGLQMGNRPTAVRWDGEAKWAFLGPLGAKVVMSRPAAVRSWRRPQPVEALSPAKKFCEVLAEGPAAGLRDQLGQTRTPKVDRSILSLQ